METLGSSKNIFSHSIRFFKTYPISILPVLISWAGYAAIVLYADFGYDWSKYSTEINFLFLFGCYISFAILFGLANLVVLEMMQQIESGNPISLAKATGEAIVKDLWRSLPLLLVWGFLWCILSILTALFSKKNGSEKTESESFSAHNAVGALLGEGVQMSLSAAFFQALSKGLRMTVFLMLPAIAWEDVSASKSFRKGLDILKDIRTHFVVAYGMTGLFTVLILLPPALLYKLDDIFHLQLPEMAWIIVFLYVAFASSLGLIVEQIYVAELYLWHIDWRKKNEERLARGQLRLPFGRTRMPSFFDEDFVLRK